MDEAPALRPTAIRFWERGRIVYNFALVLPAAVGYLARAGISAGVGDQPELTTADVVRLFLASAIGANICYTFAYVLEFFFGRVRGGLWWGRTGRRAVLIVGTAIGIVAAFYGGGGIATVQYPDRFPV